MKKYTIEFYNDIKNIIPIFTIEYAESILKKGVETYNCLDNLNDFESKVAIMIIKKYIALYNGYILNHTTSKLSDLDIEMIETVPQGGNWKHIRQETRQKSKRLQKIAQTGGRTTLYGRIDYNKPSYTITTCFNRPGNGTYVHPIHNRVISVREAARFQTFQDDYYFYGNKKEILNQVGNAVPVFLAYQIGKKIKDKIGCYKSVDLFCGAGGMTTGFKKAGIISLLGNDIDKSACITLKVNNPEINVLCGDITQQAIKNKISSIALEQGADIICGGPPCQGFSMAGFRADNDPRNQLFRNFIDVIKKVKPKIIVFENVEGLLSYQKGKIYKEIHQLFSELGYNTNGRVMSANEFGVSQKRKRVIIICARDDLNIMPSELFPQPITIEAKKQITAKDTIKDLEIIECSESAKYKSNNVNTATIDFLRNHLSYEDYIAKIQD